MPVVLMATMWLLLVNTVKSTGQWYFPGERAGGVREGVGLEGRGGVREDEAGLEGAGLERGRG